ncbi:hypothetical protein YenMTG1_086 [Yersinia phage vB_YenM_TG1]|uniref:Uncharacterized protein n=1 Tax=Yersinia phage vB_YenM_TG1 TaxID=1589265 RepID=A0A0B5A4A5_9CAUD|nr:hypothetical protein AVV33_gp086 [Yersinia phage vB_YenM_TG1]AJD81896.1 hypothetical protein YenMTG1_086 [Yersinia phage vB_YenM_TG1]
MNEGLISFIKSLTPDEFIHRGPIHGKIENTMTEFEFNTEDEDDIEHLLYVAMTKRATKDILYAIKNPWGEFVVNINGEEYGVQWQYVGLACYSEPASSDEPIDVDNWYWEYGGPDFEVSCLWKN